MASWLAISFMNCIAGLSREVDIIVVKAKDRSRATLGMAASGGRFLVGICWLIDAILASFVGVDVPCDDVDIHLLCGGNNGRGRIGLNLVVLIILCVFSVFSVSE